VAKIYGLEGQLSMAATNEITFSASAAYNHARYTSYTNASVFPPEGTLLNSAIPAAQDWSGLRIIGAPDWTANLGFKYARSTVVGALGAGGNIYYSSAYAPGYDDQLNGTYRYEQGGYAVVNLNVSLQPDAHWKVLLWGRNVTDRRVKIAYSGNPFGDSAVYAEPRTCGIKVEYSLK
jgi:iron complex outermembrane receptor protein